MKASCTPCDASVTVSLSGHFVALMRLRNSIRSASGASKRNGRIAVLSVVCSRCGARDATAVRVLRPRREATLGVISIWSAVFIYLFVFRFLQLLFHGFLISVCSKFCLHRQQREFLPEWTTETRTFRSSPKAIEGKKTFTFDRRRGLRSE